MKTVHHHANGRFDWLISEDQSVNPSREAISILSGKYKRFTFVHPVGDSISSEKHTGYQAVESMSFLGELIFLLKQHIL